MKIKNNVMFSKSISETFTKMLIKNLNVINFNKNNENDENYNNTERIMLKCLLFLVNSKNNHYSTQENIHPYINVNDLMTTKNNICFVILESVNYSYDLWNKENKFILKNIFYDEKLKKLENKLHFTKIQFNYKVEIYLNNSSMNDAFLFIDKIAYFFRKKNFIFDYYGTKLYAYLNPFYNSNNNYNNNLLCENDKIVFNIIVEAYYPLSEINFDSLLYCHNDQLIDWNKLNIEKNDEKFLSSSQSNEIIKTYSNKFKDYFKKTFNEEYDLGDINNAYWYIHLLYNKENI